MATQPGSASEPRQFDLAEQLKRKFSLGPRNWDRFKAAADGTNAEAYVPPSGAHVTLKDLARDPSTISFPSNDDPAVRAALEDDGGWVGAPDPAKFAPGTTHLSPRELQEELAKGNIMLWKDFKQQVSELQGEDAETMAQLVQESLAKHRMFVTLKDGSKVSLWDLHQYVHNNPELQALYERGRNLPVADPTDPAGRPLPQGPVSAVNRSAGLDVAVMTAQEAEQEEMDWGHVGSGAVWRRRPTRWLWGADGAKDWDVEVYAHEPMTNQVLGAKWGARDPYAVVRDPAYARDVLRCGPLMGMSFVLTAARDMPLREVASTWRDLLTSYLQRQAPLELPRRLRPTPLDLTDLNGITWPQLFDREETHGSGTRTTHGSQGRPQPLLEGRRSEEGCESTDAGCDELGVSWRLMERQEHEESVAQGLALLQALPDMLCPEGGPSFSAPSPSAPASASPSAPASTPPLDPVSAPPAEPSSSSSPSAPSASSSIPDPAPDSPAPASASASPSEPAPSAPSPPSDPPSAPSSADWPLSGSRLVDSSGRTWRRGSALWLTLEPEGGITVQARSPGVLREQQSYLLGRVGGAEALAGALMDAFLGPQPLDPQMAATARNMLLLPTNGFTAGNKDGDPHHPLPGMVPTPELPKLPADPSAFRLADSASRQPGQPGREETFVQGIHQTRVAYQVRGLLLRALEAAAGAAAPDTAAPTLNGAASTTTTTPGSTAAATGAVDTDEAAAAAVSAIRLQPAAREAAVRVLREGLGELAPEGRAVLGRAVQALGLRGALESGEEAGRQAGRVADLFSLARSLDGVEGEVKRA